MKEAPKFTAALKKRWVKALRSGYYKQGHDELKTKFDYESPKYCCLGVLCQITRYKSSDTGLIQNEKSKCVILPKGIQNKLADLNDDEDERNDFKTIADYIEKKVKVKNANR